MYHIVKGIFHLRMSTIDAWCRRCGARIDKGEICIKGSSYMHVKCLKKELNGWEKRVDEAATKLLARAL